MFLDYFLALLLSHLAGDFVFQSDQLCKLKKDPDIKQRVLGISIHVVIIMLINITVFALMDKGIPWIVLFIVNFFHWLLDMVKSTILAKNKIYDSDSVMTGKIAKTSVTEKTSVIEIKAYDSDQAGTFKRELENEKIAEKISKRSSSTGQTEAKPKNKLIVCLFIGDQLLHIISIFIAAHALYSFDVNHYMSFYDQLVSGTVTVSRSLTIMKKILLVLIYLCLATSVSNVIVKMFLSGLRKDLGADVKTGRYIGGVERILTISIILAGAWQALTVLYGSKTAIRFDQAKDNPDFAEYYILGTTLSALFAVIIAVAAKITLL
ncbi:hypothetical protein UF75_4297 [Desulfosporosinus sp. I2]|uniref:DUF3307 domain-containing protein n=1 Tax=Desulfosporosinus sp. I2 TaxID=1617025 RepID=UPI0005EDD4D5|nr:DUF3307 domain-containing protein [Desulfosporosinus sp. I2]KJR45308.1 hypothetical protein UF75_4297 [Desulfosporosinus sp. I2]